MLARITHGIFWLGRNLGRAEHTARMLDGVALLQLQGRSDEGGLDLDWGAALAIMGADPGPQGGDALARLALDADEPASVVACIARAREGARTVRDVLSVEMWEAINTTSLLLPRDSPRAVPDYVKGRCALFWGLTGRTMLRDEAHAFLRAGSRIEAADMVLRMLRVALSTTRGTGPAVAMLHAVGGAQAYRRAVPAAPTAAPVTRFLLYESAYPDSVAASVDALLRALTEADVAPRRSAPVLRLQRLLADLEFRRRAVPDEDLAATCEAVQAELGEVDRDIAERYFAGGVAA